MPNHARIGLRALLASLLFLTSATETLAGVQRIISTDASATEIILALGKGQELVAVDTTSKLPPEQADLPRLGYHRALAAEGVLGQAPDFIIGSELMGPAHVLATLQRAGIELLQLPIANSLDVLAANVATLQARLLPQQQMRSLNELAPAATRLREQSSLDIEAVFLLSTGGGKLRMAGTGTAGDAFIRLLGASNAADYVNYRSISAEALVKLAPDVILVADIDGQSDGQLLRRNPILRYSPAGASNLFY